MEGVERCPECGTEIILDPKKTNSFEEIEGNYKKHIHACHICGYRITLGRIWIQKNSLLRESILEGKII
jgi:DNA-directed RNA polymerase subunit RPC12/RpoP